MSTAPSDSWRRLIAPTALLALIVPLCADAHGKGVWHRNAVFGLQPSLSKAFAPGVIPVGGSSLVTITLTNPNAMPATLSGELDDTLPMNVVIGGGAAATTCPNGHVSAIGGFAVFALNFGAEIPAQGSCIVTVCVTTDMAGVYTNTLAAGALLTDDGNNADPASANLEVTADIIFADAFEGQCSL